jgi:hypothetical protein
MVRRVAPLRRARRTADAPMPKPQRLAVLVSHLSLSRRKKRETRSRRARKKLLRGMNSVGLFESSGCCGGSIEGYH